jgi:hypothetical protein
MAAALAVLLSGCTQWPGPVQQVAIDAANVRRIVLDVGRYEFIVTDADVIRRCVYEINGLSYEAYWPAMGHEVRETFVLEDKDGNKVAGFGFSQVHCVRVFLPGSKPFYVGWGSLSAIGRLYSYGYYATSRENLIGFAKREGWDKETMRAVSHHIGNIHMARPDLHLTEPSNLEDLRGLVKALPEAQPDMLDQFADRFK